MHHGHLIGPYTRNSAAENEGEGLILNDTPIKGTIGHQNTSSNVSFSNEKFDLSARRASDHGGQSESIQTTPSITMSFIICC